MRRLVFLMILFCGKLLAEGPRFSRGEKAEMPGHLLEASGMVASQQNPDYLWLINDSGNKAELHLINATGKDRGTVALPQIHNRDWEDLASYREKDRSFLVICDTGDNTARRKSVFLYIIEEPKISSAGQLATDKATVSRIIEIAFEDGPRDCEAVAVDSHGKQVFLLSKRTSPPLLYAIPLHSPKNVCGTAKLVGEVALKAPGFSFGPYGNQPTAMDISPDGKSSVVSTYSGIFHFSRKKGQSWNEAFTAKPRWIGSHKLAQAEAIAFSKDGQKFHVGSEGKPPKLVTFQATE